MRDVTILLALAATMAVYPGRLMGDDRPKGEAIYDKVPLEHREWYVTEYRDELAEARRDLDTAKRHVRTRIKKRRRALLAKYVNAVEKLEKNDPPYLPHVWPPTFQVGRFGPLPNVEVFQVQGPTLMLVKIPGRLASNYPVFLVSGVSTDSVVDGSRLELDGVYRVTGTKTYPTAAGSTNTVFVVEPFDETSVFNPGDDEKRKREKAE